MTPSWRRYVRFWGARVDDDVDEELAFHVEMRVRDFIARGLGERDARDAAERRFGNRGRVRNRCLTIGHRRHRRMTRAQTVDALVQDLHYGLRTLGRQKAWTAVALLTMALGIGASTAMFSAVNSLLLNPLPYRDGNRIAMVWRAEPKSGVNIAPSKEMLAAWKAQTRVFDAVEEYGSSQMTLSGRGDASDVLAGRMQPTFPTFAGVGLLAGRTFLPEEMVAGGAPAVVLGERLWRERFAGSPSAIGQRLTLNDKPYTIVGIAPSRLRLPMIGGNDADLWLPLVKDSLYFGGIVARVRQGLAFDAAAKELTGVIDRNKLAADDGPREYITKLVRPADLIGFRSSLFLLSAAVGLLLLVACANVAHLLLARGATRERELAIRVALGAGRWRLARQLLTESTMLAMAGCIAGVAVGYAGVRALAVLRPDSLNALSHTRVDAYTLLVAVAMSAFAGIAFGCTAALHAVRRTTSDALRASASSGTGAPQTHRLRSLLVVTEMALSAMLLVGAALLVRSVIKLQHVETGFDTRNLYAMTVNLARERYPSGTERSAFIDRVADAARQLPGVVGVTRATATPPKIGGFMMSPVEIEGGAAAAPPSVIPMNFVAPSYFQVLGIRVEGSTFGPASIGASEVIINRGFAAKYWPGQTALGHRFRFKGRNQKPEEDWLRIVGIADDVPTQGLSADRTKPFLYQPADPTKGPTRTIVVVRTTDGVNVAPALRRIVTAMDSRLVPPPVITVEADLAKTISRQRFTMLLLAVFATLAVVLSAIGLYGVISYVVTQRTREIGIRVALGATPSNVARTIAVRGLALSVAGLAIGLIGAVWGTRLIRTALFEVAGTDPASYALAAATLLGVSAVACTVPMRRAMRVDPVIAMRGE